jgi:hypothetical protein
MAYKPLWLLVVAGAAPHVARAEPIGTEISVGGGVTEFTDQTLRNTTSPAGGMWSIRAALGTHVPLGLEVAYLGTATQVRSLYSSPTSTLIGTTFEADLRLNLLPRYVIDPYVFGGIGAARYSLQDSHFALATTGVASHDDMMEVPIGAGISYRWAGIVADMRGTFRATDGSQLVLAENANRVPTTGQFAPMHSWDATLALGYEF